MEVEDCGTGIMLIKREAIATMLKTLPGSMTPTQKGPLRLPPNWTV